MANLLYANNAVGTLASAITNAQTAITLNAGQASLFPNPSAPQVFYATLTDAATQTLKEIVQVTAVSGNIFSVVRAQDGTTALSWNAGDFIEQCAIRLEMQGWENAAEGLFGSTGANVAIRPSTTLGIVGTTLGDVAAPGSVGEFQTAAATVTATTGVPANAATLTLTPGDWNVWGVASIQPGAGQGLQSAVVGINTSSGVIGAGNTFTQIPLPGLNGFPCTLPTPLVRINISTSTAVYLVYEILFGGGGTMSINGAIEARRVR